MHTQYVIWPYQRTKSLRSGFCILFPPVVIWLSVKFKFTGVGTSGLFIHSSHSSPGLPPSPCSHALRWLHGITMTQRLWRCYGSRLDGLGMCWWKRQPVRDRERGRGRERGYPPQQLGTITPLPASSRPLQPFKHHPDPGNTENFTFIIHHTLPAHPSQPSSTFSPQPNPNSVTHQFIHPIFKILL